MKQVILVRQDLKLPKGKLSAQVAHAAVDAASKAPKENVLSWKSLGMAKIVLKVKDEKELMLNLQKAKEAGLPVALITDAGRTVVEPGTTTCVAVGPAPSEKLDDLFGELKLL